jgi:hypothetical protein
MSERASRTALSRGRGRGIAMALTEGQTFTADETGSLDRVAVDLVPE